MRNCAASCARVNAAASFTEADPVKPQERDELAKHRKLEAIDAGLNQHDKKVQVTLLLVVILNVVLLALVVYQILGHN
jgi:hypothetical protein